MILIVSMTAIIDRRDVAPMAIEMAGGVVKHFGVPVDPGNLLLIGYGSLLEEIRKRNLLREAMDKSIFSRKKLN